MLVYGFGFMPSDSFDDDLNQATVNLLTSTGMLIFGEASAPEVRTLNLSEDDIEAARQLAAAAHGVVDERSAVPESVRVGWTVFDGEEHPGGPRENANAIAKAFMLAANDDELRSSTVDGFVDKALLTRPRKGGAYVPRVINGDADVEMLRTLTAAGLVVEVQGPPGSGKTMLCHAAFKDHLTVIPCSSITTIADLVGMYKPAAGGNFEWSDGPLVKAMEAGQVVLLDDAGELHPSVQAALHPVLDSRRYIDVLDRPDSQRVTAASEFRVVLTVNPGLGFGLTDPIGDRVGATVSVPVDFAVARRLGVPALFVELAELLHERAERDAADGVQRWEPSLRELLGARNVAAQDGDNSAQKAGLVLASKAPSGEERNTVIELLRHKFGAEFATDGVLVAGGIYEVTRVAL